ncbi:MAG: DEAD/DEAH box helicase, partial [Acidimicrobiia bacterium]
VTPPAGDALVEALVSAEATLVADAGETEKLRRTLADWLRSGQPAAGPLRTCFRLVPPAEGGPEPGDEDTVAGPRWRVEFLLQSTEDPTLLVPADEVWRAGPGLRSLRHATEHPPQHLLADLGRATRLYPELEAALDVARPAALDLDAAGAHRFLADVAPLLEQAGFGVLVPPWWRSPGGRLGLRLRAQPRPAPDIESSSGFLGLDGLCDYRYDVALGGEVLSRAELADLARCKAPLVRMRGQWVELRPGEAKAALALLRQTGKAPGQMTAAAVLRVGLGLDPAPDAPLPVVDVEADGWLGELLSPDGDRRLEPVPTPAGFAGELRPYQQRGLAWLRFLDRLGLGACLADDMGLGKTAQLLALLAAERDGVPDGSTSPPPRGRRRVTRPRPTLLVCPMSVVGNWQREAARFTPGLSVHVHHGATRETGAAFTRAIRRADLVVTTYALVARDRELLAKARWGRIALDEAQNVKNPASQAARAVRLLPAGARVALTGTPVENRLLELWSLMDFLNPGLLGSETAFRRRFAVPIERFRDEDAARTVKRLTGPFALRRLKTDKAIIADLPDKIEMKVLTNLTREQASLYQAVVDDMLARIEAAGTGIERMGIISASMMKLKQVCNHPAHLLGDGSRLAGRSGKLARLEEILEEVTGGGERALCFTQFAEMGRLLQAHLAERLGRDVPFLHGGVTKRARDEMVDRFSDPAGPPLLLLSLKAGGVGLNLTAANHVIHFDRWWNPAVEDQATDRAFRIGQRKDVQVRKFVCVGTLEERIDAMIEDKRDLAARIVGTGEAWLHELSVTQLREMVALSDDAVAED